MNLDYLIKQARDDKVDRLNVAVAFVNQESKILICQRAKDKKYLPNVWHIPGGQVEDGESVEAGASREIKEELGLDILGSIYDTSVVHDYTGHGDQKARTVFVLAKASGNIQLDFENQDYVFISKDQIDKYFEPHVVEINTQVFSETLKLIERLGAKNTLSEML